MSMDPAFDELLKHIVFIKLCTGTDEWGNKTYGPAASSPCRIGMRAARTMAVTGQTVTSSTAIDLPPTASIDEDAIVLLPAEWRNTVASGYCPVAGIQRYADVDGTLHHIVVTL